MSKIITVYLFSPLRKFAGRAIYFACVNLALSAKWPNGLYILARSAKLPEGLYILPMFFLYFFLFFSGRHRSPAGSEANGPIFTKISVLVDR